MANLRTNNLSGEQGQNAYRGAVFFHGGGQIDVTSNSDFSVGTGAYTAEVWFLSGLNSGENSIFGTFTASNYGFGMWHNANNLYFEERQNSYSGDNPRITYDKFEEGYWYHLAMCRDSSSGTLRAYVNGVQIGSTTTNLRTIAGTAPTIGENNAASNQCNGYISNIRFSNTELYPSGTTFTPPTFELTADASTILLACQNSDDPTQEETGKTLTNSSLISGQPEVIPPYGVDAGNAFGGPIQQSSQGYMYFPTGRTEERGRGRAVFLGGGQPSVSTISFTQIQSTGNAQDFGTISAAKQSLRGGSSTTRGLSTHSSDSPYTNTIEFITIATTGDALDFGDMSGTSTTGATGTNETRAVFWIGTNPSTNVIDFATIASLGNTSDFGDMSVGVRHIDTMNSSTRCVIPGGWTSGGVNTNVIQFITFATTGNAQDFGDVDYSGGARASGGFSSPTRGVFAGGADSPSNNAINIIHFVTLASTGNSTDFGDISAAKRIEGGGTSSHIRGIIAGSNSPAQVNTIEFVTIASTGDAQDFGDLLSSRSQDGYVGALSDCHGGLS